MESCLKVWWHSQLEGRGERGDTWDMSHGAQFIYKHHAYGAAKDTLNCDLCRPRFISMGTVSDSDGRKNGNTPRTHLLSAYLGWFSKPDYIYPMLFLFHIDPCIIPG